MHDLEAYIEKHYPGGTTVFMPPMPDLPKLTAGLLWNCIWAFQSSTSPVPGAPFIAVSSR